MLNETFSVIFKHRAILWIIEDLYCFAILLLPKLIIWCIILSCHISCQMSGEIAKKVQWTQVRLEMLIFKIAKISLVSPLGMLKDECAKGQKSVASSSVHSRRFDVRTAFLTTIFWMHISKLCNTQLKEAFCISWW